MKENRILQLKKDSNENKVWGGKVKYPDNTIYHRTKAGNLVRETSRRCEASENIKNHGVRRRLKKAGIL